MSSLHRHKRSPFWYVAFRGPDGRLHFKSTFTTVKREAEVIREALNDSGRLARKRLLTPDRARRVIEDSVRRIIEQTGHQLPHSTIRDYFTSWIAERENAAAESTFARYDGIVRRFLEFLGTRADDSLTSLTKSDLLTYRDSVAAAVSGNTVNVHLKVLRVALSRAVREQLIERNPAALVERSKTADKLSRRAFTLPELKKLLAVATGNWSEWRTMILVGIYTGLRLQDAVNLTWESVDLQEQEITVTTEKTGRTVIVPIARPLLRELERLASSDDPKAPLCPALESKSSSWLSNEFYDLMTAARLVPARDHQRATGKGRGSRRRLTAISFHCLRHTATSMLKRAGVSDVIARDIIGHESEAVSRNYTHIDTETKRKALNRVEDVVRLTEQLDLKLDGSE